MKWRARRPSDRARDRPREKPPHRLSTEKDIDASSAGMGSMLIAPSATARGSASRRASRGARLLRSARGLPFAEEVALRMEERIQRGYSFRQ